MEIIWITEKVIDDREVITHIDWTATAQQGVHMVSHKGRAELPLPDPALVEAYLRQPTAEQLAAGIGWVDLPDPPGFKRPEWIERDTLHPWLFAIIDRDAVELELVTEIQRRQTPSVSLDEATDQARNARPDLFSNTGSPQTVSDPMGEALETEKEPYVPDFTIIPDQLEKFAQDGETAAQFRSRLKLLWQRFGIEDGKNFPGGGEALTGEEKITMREIDIVLNSEEGQKAGLLDWMKADKPQN